MLLEGKNAIIYGGAGPIGSAVAAGFAREGATVHLTGRTLSALDAVAGDIRAAGGTVHTAAIDALDPGRISAHADHVADSAGGIDISFNAIGLGDVHGTPLAEMSLELFERPIVNAARTMFLTTQAAARHMIDQGSGVLLFFGGDGGRDPVRDYNIGGFQVAMGLIDTLRRQLAAELGPRGIRAVTLQSGGIAEAIPADEPDRDAITEMILAPTMLGRTATFDDVGNVAAFVCSDKAGSITAASINITAGAVAD
ncbi:SDR family oxidoreductase [Streptomyces sp. DSM 44917]|uniref:SDR family oxidoreductase n=1 Tax=Streptomyces boetiae TaxID=3075541 RepID=A0ABU2LC09_9ACTN|nr:SDR family oxidoreductase [Streptomyces sp. DSM 44917]MDT0308723.1 SDR family oxidoreductase [Streptomyces sp. DSM 44917]